VLSYIALKNVMVKNITELWSKRYNEYVISRYHQDNHCTDHTTDNKENKQTDKQDKWNLDLFNLIKKKHEHNNL